MSSLCNNYIFDFLYLIRLFSLDSRFICCLGELQILVFHFHMLCSSNFLKPRVFLKILKLDCCKDDLNVNLCFVFFFCIHQCGVVGPSFINVGQHDPRSLYLVLVL